MNLLRWFVTYSLRMVQCGYFRHLMISDVTFTCIYALKCIGPCIYSFCLWVFLANLVLSSIVTLWLTKGKQWYASAMHHLMPHLSTSDFANRSHI